MGLLPDFSSLPPWGQVIAYAVFALSVGAVLLAARLGIKLRGTPLAAGNPQQTATVAAVVVDPTALMAATVAVEALNITLSQMNAIARGKVKADIALTREYRAIHQTLIKQEATMSQLADLIGAYVSDQREERETEESRRRDAEQQAIGYQRAKDEARTSRNGRKKPITPRRKSI